MQGQRSTANAFLEAFEFEGGSSSRDGQEICWSNMTNSGSDVQPLTGGSGSQRCTVSSTVARPVVSANSSDPSGSSSTTVRNLGDDNGSRSGCSADRRHLSGKRKRLESEAGQSSLGEDSSLLQSGVNIEHFLPAEQNRALPPESPLNVNSLEGELNPALCASASGSVADCPYLCIRSGAESSQRSVRMRLDPTDAPESSRGQMFPSGSFSRSYFWSPNSFSSGRSFSSSRHADMRSMIASTSSPHRGSSSQLLRGGNSNLHSLRWNGGTNLRIGSSSGSSGISAEGSSVSVEDANLNTLPECISEHLIFSSPSSARCLTQDQVSPGSTSGNVQTSTNLTSLTGSSSAPSRPTAGWVPSQNPLPPLPHWISRVQRSLIPSSDYDPGTQSCAFPPSGSAPATSSAEMMFPSAAGVQRNPHHYLRSAFLLDRTDDSVVGAALSMRNLQAANEGRFRLIQNALDLIRRGESLRFEDVWILDQPAFYSRADLHDRHRDMRLDVDNMSYEELLALEERIGNVSTGLSEETIIKCLKNRKYDSAANNQSTDVGPCCICQEEYVDDEELGILECGHDFHRGCIMQWLMLKNLCPICKTTALVTTATTTLTTCSDV